MKKRIASLLSLLILCGMLPCFAACSAGGNPPELEDVYDRLVTVIEASHEVNVLLFGAGLPVYPRGSEEDEMIHRYYGVNDDGMEYVTPYAKFPTVAAMQNAMAAVYSTAYRESLNETLFTGYADSGMSVALPARYHEDERYLYQSRYVEPLVKGTRVYDYAAMEIVEPSNATRIRVAVPSYTENRPDEWVTVYLSFVYENGNWYLDSPSC